MKTNKPLLSLSDIAFEIANEPATKEDGTPLINNGKNLTKAEKILRQWAVSDNPVLQSKFMELALTKSVEKEKEEEKPKGISCEAMAYIRICVLGIGEEEDFIIMDKLLGKEKVRNIAEIKAGLLGFELDKNEL